MMRLVQVNGKATAAYILPFLFVVYRVVVGEETVMEVPVPVFNS